MGLLIYMNNRRRILNKVFLYIIVFFVVIIILQILGILACAIPRKLLYNNVKETSEQLYNIGEKYEKSYLNKSITNFYFTDILMVNISYSVDNQRPFESFILARKNYNSDKKGYVETMGKDVLASDEYMNLKNGTANELLDFVEGKGIKKTFEYSRYWNGYITFLRPLLCIMDYKKIIILLLLLTLVLITVYSIEIYKHSNIYMVIAFILPLILTDMFFSMLTINANICFIIAIISSIIVVKNKKENINTFIFFTIGILTNFLDLLTLPLLTVGYPLISLIILYRKRKDDKILTKEILINLLSWILGYAICWVSKWIITDIIFKRNVILNAINQIIFRTAGDGFSIKHLIFRITYYLGYFNCALMLVLMLMYYIMDKRKTYYNVIIYMPIIWLVALKNHSTVHAFFTYKELQITMFAVMSATLDNRIIKNGKRKNKNAIKK